MDQELTKNKKEIQELKKMRKRMKIAGYFWSVLSILACIGIFMKVDVVTINVALIVIFGALSTMSLMIAKIISLIEYLFENNTTDE